MGSGLPPSIVTEIIASNKDVPCKKNQSFRACVGKCVCVRACVRA
jgi:hypothetical protein